MKFEKKKVGKNLIHSLNESQLHNVSVWYHFFFFLVNKPASIWFQEHTARRMKAELNSDAGWEGEKTIYDVFLWCTRTSPQLRLIVDK